MATTRLAATIPALCMIAAAQPTGPRTGLFYVMELRSPDGQIAMQISGGSNLTYEVTYRGVPVIARSVMGFEFQGQAALGPNITIAPGSPGKISEQYLVPAGKASTIRNECNTATVEARETATPNRRLTIEARAYNEGVAFRYLLPEQEGLSDFKITNERTQFLMGREGTAYPLILRNYRTSWEDNYHTLPISGLHPEYLIAMPLLMELPGTAYVAIAEANIENYSGMYLQHDGRNALALNARLSPRIDDPAVSVTGKTPLATPWRVILIGSEPGRLIESNMVLNLNPPSAIADTSWIKPGKASWDWWSGPYDEGVNFRPGKNTETIKHYVDFSSQAGFEYFMLDAGWAVVVRGGPSDSGVDLTKVRPEINMPEVLDYARSKNVKLWLWAHWTDVDRQMEAAFPLYEKWGIAGVKIDFMDRDDQQMVDFYRRTAKFAAEHHLMVDFHGAYKPDGLERTWPNVLTREGVLGLEYNKWSGRVTPEHNVMLAFTRLIAGPMDYTPGGFLNVTREEFQPRNLHPMVMGTRAHQTALFVVYLSPFEMVSDHPEAYQGQKELKFLSAVPATWDETRVITGRVGEYIAVARRKGREWFIGSIAGRNGVELDLPLEFLGTGDYTAEIYSDAPDADVHPMNTVVGQQKVNRAGRIHVKMAPGGGQAVHIRPGV
ncbi:MAG TPA: glycoside hydrolase family 97 protein [Candidatus Acidoferrales bacterium]|nr:glycoside hydrolase family 97 protein [Candidatus Acidoferrales bacterium]